VPIILISQLRVKWNCEGRSSTWSNRRLSKCASGSCHLMTRAWSRCTAAVEWSAIGAINPNPPCQHSLHAGENLEYTSKNPRLSFTRVSWVRRANPRSHWKALARTIVRPKRTYVSKTTATMTIEKSRPPPPLYNVDLWSNNHWTNIVLGGGGGGELYTIFLGHLCELEAT
jgi:hypothetical protein